MASSRILNRRGKSRRQKAERANDHHSNSGNSRQARKITEAILDKEWREATLEVVGGGPGTITPLRARPAIPLHPAGQHTAGGKFGAWANMAAIGSWRATQ